MKLNINNEIETKKENNKEITEFMNQLNNELEKKQELSTTNNLFDEILQDVELAQKYKSRLQSTINKCLEDLSYERDFFYFDYDKRRKDYCLKYYWNGGNTVCDNLTKEDIEDFKKSGFTFYEPFDEEGTIRQSDTLKDWMKCEVSNTLLDIDIKNRKSKENKDEL